MAGQGALSALATHLARLRAASTPERLPAAASRVGETFLRAADDVPDMFERGRSFADSARGLAEQFDTGPMRWVSRDNPISKYVDYHITANPKGTLVSDGAGLKGQAFSKPGLAAEYPMFSRDASYPGLRQAMDAGLLGRINHVWDTQSMNLGTGAGTKVYASAFGNLSNMDPDADVNVSAGLSGVNSLRRSYNTASALARDPSLANRIIVAPSQLNSKADTWLNSGLPLDVASFHKLSPAQQLGALQLVSAQRALESMRVALLRDQVKLNDVTDEPGTRLRRMNAIGAMNRDVPRFEDPDAAKAIAAAYAVSPSSATIPVGPRSIRKAQLVNDILGGSSFEDLAGRFSGLEFAQGGHV